MRKWKLCRKIKFTWLLMLFVCLASLVCSLIFSISAKGSSLGNVRCFGATKEFFGVDGNGNVFWNDNQVNVFALLEKQTRPDVMAVREDVAYIATDSQDFLIVQNGELKVAAPFSGVAVGIDVSADGSYVALLTKINRKRRLLIGSVEQFQERSEWLKIVNLDSLGESVDIEQKNGELLFHVTKEDPQLIVFNIQGETVKEKVLPDVPVASGVLEGKRYVYCENGFVYVLNDAYEVVSQKKIGSGYNGMVVDEDNKLLIFSEYNGRIVSYDQSLNEEYSLETEYELISVIVDQQGEIFCRFNDGSTLLYQAKAPLMNTLSVVFLAVGLVLLVLGHIAIFIWSFKINAQVKEATIRFKDGVKKHWFPIITLLPIMAAVVLFCYYPVVDGFRLAFLDYKPGVYSRFVGVQNFVSMFKEPRFWYGFKNLAILTGTGLIKAVVPPIITALMIFSLRSKKLQYASRALLYIPTILPGVAGLFLWKSGIYGTNGLLNDLLGLKNYNWLANTNTAIWLLTAVGFPWVGSFLIFFGAFSGIPNDYREAAILEGCGYFRRILTIELPFIMPQIKYVFIMALIGNVQEFNTVFVMLGRDPDITNYVPMLEVYNQISYGNYGLASAMGVFMFVILFGATFMSFRSKKEEVAI